MNKQLKAISEIRILKVLFIMVKIKI